MQSTVTGGAQEVFYKEKKDLFFLKSYDCQFLFTRNGIGQITGLTGFLGKKSFEYERAK